MFRLSIPTTSGGEETEKFSTYTLKPPLSAELHPRGERNCTQRDGRHVTPPAGHPDSSSPVGCGPVDARTFLGMEPDGDTLHWRGPVAPELTTPGNFWGCGLGAALRRSRGCLGSPNGVGDPPTCYALLGSAWEVTLAAVGGHVTQGRAVGRGQRGARSSPSMPPSVRTSSKQRGVGRGTRRPSRLSAGAIPTRAVPATPSWTSIEVRSAKGRTFEEMDGSPGNPDSALWARVPGHLTPSAATLAIVGDYVSGAVSQPIGRRPWDGASDNTPADGPVEADRVGALRHPDPCAVHGGSPRGSPICGPRTANSSRQRAIDRGGRLWPEDAVPCPDERGAMTPSPARQRNWFPWLVTPQPENCGAAPAG